MGNWLPLLGLFLAEPAANPPSAEPVSAPEPAPEFRYILSAWVNPESCNLRIAEPVNLRNFLAESAPWQGRCIALTGIWGKRRALFLAHADARRKYAWSEEATEGRRVGIYAHDDVWAEAPRRARLSTLVGRVGHCETNGFWGGYCHYTGGPFIMVAEAYDGRRSATDRLRPAR